MFVSDNGAHLSYTPRLSTSQEIKSISPETGKATLTLKLVSMTDPEMKFVKKSGQRLKFRSYELCGADPQLLVHAEAWSENVEKLEQILRQNGVSPLGF